MEEKNYIRARIIIEMLGKPKEHIEKTLKAYIEKIKQDELLMVINTEFAESEKKEEDIWATFAELELVFKNLLNLFGFCFDYMPSSIEIIKPERLALTNLEITSMINDLQAKLHDVDMVAKKLNMENDFLKRNLQTSLQNTVMILLKANKLTKEQISKYTGIDEKEIEPFISEMVKQEKIKKDGEVFSLK